MMRWWKEDYDHTGKRSFTGGEIPALSRYILVKEGILDTSTDDGKLSRLIIFPWRAWVIMKLSGD